jgi:predicted RNA-binding protein with PUA-like domain
MESLADKIIRMTSSEGKEISFTHHYAEGMFTDQSIMVTMRKVWLNRIYENRSTVIRNNELRDYIQEQELLERKLCYTLDTLSNDVDRGVYGFREQDTTQPVQSIEPELNVNDYDPRSNNYNPDWRNEEVNNG